MDYKKELEDFRSRMQEFLDNEKKLINNSVRAEDLKNAFPELVEIKDERMWELIKKYAHCNISDMVLDADHITREQLESWLEKQGKEGYALRSSNKEDVLKLTERIEKLARDYDINLPNRSYDIHAFAKDLLCWLEKQGEQKPVNDTDEDIVETVKDTSILDMTEPKFFEGQWVVYEETGSIYQIKNCIENVTNHKYGYELTNGSYIATEETNHFHLWTVKDVKEGDILQLGKVTAIFKKYIGQGNCICYCSVCDGEFEAPIENGEDNVYGCIDATPATKEQREALMKAMDEAGYTFDFETEELHGLEYEEDNIEDGGIDGLYHAQRILEKTLGKVDGYQTDDGILDHKAAINAVKKLNEQKSV